MNGLENGYSLISVTYNNELGYGTYKEMQELKKSIQECNKDMGLKEKLKIEKIEYYVVFPKRIIKK